MVSKGGTRFGSDNRHNLIKQVLTWAGPSTGPSSCKLHWEYNINASIFQKLWRQDQALIVTSPMEKILNNPGLVDLAENIFGKDDISEHVFKNKELNTSFIGIKYIF